jgi:Protein of unknown function (DUF2950)
MSYMKPRRMTGDFALIAWPALFGSSGIMTFQVDQDLGTSTSRIASRITQFDFDLIWGGSQLRTSSSNILHRWAFLVTERRFSKRARLTISVSAFNGQMLRRAPGSLPGAPAPDPREDRAVSPVSD